MTVAFGNGLNLLNDVTAIALAGPHWQQDVSGTMLKQYPYLYKNGFTLKLDKVTWLFNNDLPATASVYVRATTNRGFTFAPQLASVGSDKRTITIEPFTADALLLEPSTLFFNKLEITFQISITGVTGSYQSAGKSSNPVYVCLAVGFPDSVKRYQTTVHLACSTPGAYNQDQAFLNTFDLMSPRKVMFWNWNDMAFTSPLYYYRRLEPGPGTTFNQNAQKTVAALLANSNHSGECQTWAVLLRDAGWINGATGVDYITAKPLNDFAFLVKNWDFLPNAGRDYWIMQLVGPAPPPEMQPPPDPNAKDIYGELKCIKGLDGQNSNPDFFPSEKVFKNHVFLRKTIGGVTTYYDPSYGVTYTGKQDFQNQAIAGFANVFPSDHSKLKVTRVTSLTPLGIDFFVGPPP